MTATSYDTNNSFAYDQGAASPSFELLSVLSGLGVLSTLFVRKRKNN